MTKPGVGIILAAATAVPARTLTIVSTPPGYRAVIESGASESGPFTPDSRSQVGGTKTVFTLDGATARYYLIWITSLGGRESVRINEVTGSR